MKDLEKALNEEYKETLGSITYRDKSRLYDLTSNGTRHAPTVGRIIIKRTIALAVCIAVLATGTTALAFTNPVVRSAMEEFIRARTSTDLSDKNVEDMAERLENLHAATSDMPDYRFANIKTNKYGETYDGTMFETDLTGVTASGDPDNPTGYVYRYDLGLSTPYLLLPEEAAYLDSSGLLEAFAAPDSETGEVRNWVYAFDKDGTEIVGKYIFGSTGFKTNKQLEDPNVSGAFAKISEDNPYNKFVRERTEYKLKNGTAPEIPKIDASLNLPTENLDLSWSFYFDGLPLLSDDASAECSDTEFCVVDELITTSQGTGEPLSHADVHCFKTGSAVITIKDGDDEYQFECTLIAGKLGYESSTKRIK